MMRHWEHVLGDRFLTVDYELMVADTETQVRRVLDYCGLAWHDACLNFHKNKRIVSTASMSQVNQPIYTSSVRTWEHYIDHITPLQESLQQAGVDIE